MIPAPPGYNVSLKTASGWMACPVVAFDDDGDPLICHPDGHYRTGLVHPSRLADWTLEEAASPYTAVAAEPGWYALIVYHWGEPHETVLERHPVVAWIPPADEYSGSATVIAGDATELDSPVDATAIVKYAGNANLIGYFHPDRLPEPHPDVLTDLLARLRRESQEREARQRQQRELARTAVAEGTTT